MHKEKESSPLHGWIIAFWGGMTYIGKPIPGGPLSEVKEMALSVTSFRLNPVYEIPISREPMVVNTPKGPQPVMANVRAVRPIGNFAELREIILPAGIPVVSAENLSGKNRQEIANVIEAYEEQRVKDSAMSAGIHLARS